MVAYGNIQKLKNPYLVRHIHQGRNIDNLVPDFKKDWINTSNYKISLNYFNIKMSKIISDIDKINSIKALEFFKEIYDKHLVYELKREEKFFTNKIFSKILNKISFLRNLRYFLIRNLISKKKYFEVKNNLNYSPIINSIEGKNG